MRYLVIIAIALAFSASVILSIVYAREGQYDAASFYTLWAILMFFVGESTMKEN